MKIKLKACPFCGNKPNIAHIGLNTTRPRYTIGCTNEDCILDTDLIHDDLYVLISLWNKRRDHYEYEIDLLD